MLFGHAWSHMPQFARSVLKSTQWREQLVKRVDMHMGEQIPVEQTSAPAHACPHVPQFAGSLRVLTQTPPPQSISPRIGLHETIVPLSPPPPTQWPSLEHVPPLAQGAIDEQSAVHMPPRQ